MRKLFTKSVLLFLPVFLIVWLTGIGQALATSDSALPLEWAGPEGTTQATVTNGKSGTSNFSGNKTAEGEVSSPQNHFLKKEQRKKSESGLVDCFQYYKFQSVDINLSPDKLQYQPEEKVTFQGKLTNKNRYPIFDGNLFVRISKVSDKFDQQGNDIVDEFIAKKNLVLDKNSSQKVAFKWAIPTNLAEGRYRADFFFSVGKKFNLAGLPFTNEIVGGSSEFTVSSTIKNNIHFQREATKVNGEKYNHIGNWPKVAPETKVVIEQTLVNPLGHEVKAKLSQKLYFWDALNEKDLVDNQEKEIVLPANSQKTVTYTIPSANKSVYYLQTIAETEGTKTIINTRVVTEGINWGRLNYPGLTKFPLKKGETADLFTCFHNTNKDRFVGTVEVKLTDKEGHLVTRVFRQGNITGAMQAVKKSFPAKKDYDYLKLTAQLKDSSGMLMDQYSVELDRKLLKSKSGQQTGLAGSKNIGKNTITVILIVLGAVLIIILVLLLKKMKNYFTIIFLLLFSGGLLVIASGKPALAYSGSVASTINHFHIRYYSNLVKEQKPAYYYIAHNIVTVTHKINGQSVLSCNGNATYRYQPELFFTSAGDVYDTPFGKFCDNYRNASCFGGNIKHPDYGNSLEIQGAFPYNKGYIYWTAKKPNVYLTSSDNSILKCNGLICQAQPGKSGKVRVTAHIGETQAKIWSLISSLRNIGIPRNPAINYESTSIEHFKDSGEKVLVICGDGVWREYTAYQTARDLNALQSWDPEKKEGTVKVHWWSPSDDFFNLAQKAINDQPIILPARRLSWEVTVDNCNADGVCNPGASRNNYPSTAVTPSKPLCSTGQPLPTNPEFVNGVANWQCLGRGTGKNAECHASQRVDCGPASDGTYGTHELNENSEGLCQPANAVVSNFTDQSEYEGGYSWQCSLNGQTTTCRAKSKAACNDDPTSSPYKSLTDACRFGNFNSLAFIDGKYVWRCGTAGESNRHIGSFTDTNINYGNLVPKDYYDLAGGDENCECVPHFDYSCKTLNSDACIGHCGEKVTINKQAFKHDSTCFPNDAPYIQVSEKEYKSATGKSCHNEIKQCPPCRPHTFRETY